MGSEMIKYFILLLFLSSFLLINLANGQIPSTQTNFVVKIVDESNVLVSIPNFLLIEEIQGNLTSSFRIDLSQNPQTIPVAWVVPLKLDNTIIHIVAGKDGYQKSDEFVYTITEDGPKDGLLFEHTFVLSRTEGSKISEQTFDVFSEGNPFTILAKSTSSVQVVELERNKSILVVLHEDAIRGFTEFTVPSNLLRLPVQMELDGIVVFPKVEKNFNSNTINLEYGQGFHTIRMYSISQETVTSQPSSNPSSNGGGCLIATAAYGSELVPQVQQLRELRDNYLLKTESGTSFMNSFNEFYYTFSPYIADYERENPVFKEAVKIAITPLISSLSILNYVDMDSEEYVLGYGISLIIINIGMYVAAPTIVICVFSKRLK